MIHINRFIDKLKLCETKKLKHMNLSITEARDLHGDITKLLLVLHETKKPPGDDTVQKVEISGGGW